MIQDVMRKHKRTILWLTLLLVVVPFAMWGGFAGYSRSHNRLLSHATGPVARVDGIAVSPEEFARALEAQVTQMNQRGQRVTLREIIDSGLPQQILKQLVYRAMLQAEAARMDYRFDRDILVEHLKQDPMFQNEKGQYDPKLWNQFLEQSKSTNWNAVYENMRNQLALGLVADRSTASARVLDSEVRKRFEQMHTAIQVRYVRVQPPVNPTDEQVQAYFKDHENDYAIPGKRTAAFAAISLEAPRPALVDELVQKARSGADFAELAKANSRGPQAAEGGDLGWLTQSMDQPEYRLPLFDLEPGNVSDAVQGPAGYYIYKVEEVRTDPVSNQREVHAREIQISATLTKEERDARIKQAGDLAKKARETSLEAAAAEAGLPVGATGEFSVESATIQGIPSEDVASFRVRLKDTPVDTIADPFPARRNVYVAQVKSLTPAVPQPLEAVRERVVADVKREITASEDYAKQTQALGQEIAAKCKSLEDVVANYPQLNPVVEEAKPFTLRDYDYASGGPMWNPMEVFTAVGDRAPGAFAGPVRAFDGAIYFVQLVSKTPPDQKAWDEAWPKEKDKLRDSLLAARQRAQQDDYLQNLFQTGLARGRVTINQDAVDAVLGLHAGAEDTTGATGEGSAGGSAAAETSAAPESEAATPAASTAAGS